MSGPTAPGWLRTTAFSASPVSPANERKTRADERTRTADLFSLRVIGHALQGFAQPCKYRISKRPSFLRFALRCSVLRSRWCQRGVKGSWITRSWLLFKCRSQAPACGTIGCSDLPRYPNGRTFAIAPHHRWFIRGAGCRLSEKTFCTHSGQWNG